MTIKETSHELSKMDVYRLTKSPAVLRISDVPADEEIRCDMYVIYEEPDVKEPDKVNTILAIGDKETNMYYATNSDTFRRSFKDITDIFGNTGFTFNVVPGKSKNGRTFYTAVMCREV